MDNLNINLKEIKSILDCWQLNENQVSISIDYISMIKPKPKNVFYMAERKTHPSECGWVVSDH